MRRKKKENQNLQEKFVIFEENYEFVSIFFLNLKEIMMELGFRAQ